MRNVIRLPIQLLDRIQRRFVHARPGSVLILVVVLVVLLALLGTALLSTTRSDRFTAVQNTVNTQVDLVVEAVKTMAKSAILRDLFNGGTYRPPEDSLTAGTGTSSYGQYDVPLMIDPATPPTGFDAAQAHQLQYANDIWLSPRLPSAATDSSKSNWGIFWSALGRLPGAEQFDTPMVIDRNSPYQVSLGSYSSTFTTRTNGASMPLQPTFVRPEGYTETFPAWYVGLTPAGGGAAQKEFVIAGDADGDGIADSGLVKMPGGEIDGLTYYYAVRIIDNNSAINVNTAWSSNFDRLVNANDDPETDSLADLSDAVGGAYAPATNNLGMFRSHIGLNETLVSTGTAEMNAMNVYRFDGHYTKSSDQPTYQAQSFLMTPRTDFNWTTQGDLLEHEQTGVLENLGYSSLTSKLQAFPLADMTSLAYHFVMSNPEMLPSTLERTVAGKGSNGFDSIYYGSPNYADSLGRNLSPARGKRAYDSYRVGSWYSENFNFDQIAGPKFLNGYPNGYPPPPATPDSNYSADLATFNAFRQYPLAIRSILTTWNPVANQIPMRGTASNNTTLPVPQPQPIVAGGPPFMPDYRANQPKANINTAPFNELWRAFWCVMAENNVSGTPFVGTAARPDPLPATIGPYEGMEFNQTSNAPVNDEPSGTAPLLNAQMMFRTSIRDSRTPPNCSYFRNSDMVLLRAAAAAQQAATMRDPNAQPQIITLPIQGPTPGTVNVTLFGTTPQLFITEIFATNDVTTPKQGSNNTAPYVAIELYNPFDTNVVIANDWRIVAMSRKSTDAVPYAAPTAIGPIQPVTIGPGEYLILDDFGPNIAFRPDGAGNIDTSINAAGVHYQSIAGLSQVLDREMVILRNKVAGAPPQYDEPIDSYDFTGLTPAAHLDPLAIEWHYVRQNASPTGDDRRWLCVYPGRYDGAYTAKRQQGTEWDTWNPVTGQDPWLNGAPHPATFGTANTVGIIPAYLPIPLFSSAGPNPVAGASGNKFPFGGFARNGDILEVPFICAYTILDQTNQLVEYNSISMDSAFAEDTDWQDDYPGVSATRIPPTPDNSGPRECVGRFCPLRIEDSTGNVVVDDFGGTTANYRYAWARDLFDYLTVQSPANDYFPNVSPDVYTAKGGPRPLPVDNDGDGVAAEQDGLTTSQPPLAPNNPASPNGSGPAGPSVNASDLAKEDTVPVQGLININTAPWKVLASIPWVPKGPPWGPATNDHYTFDQHIFSLVPNGVDDNIDIAKAIVEWRDGSSDAGTYIPPRGFFRSIFDLYDVTDNSPGTRVYIFRELTKNLLTAGNPGVAEGDFMPLTLGPDNQRYDFEEQYLLMNKVSNLITTRSDSFTVYIVVQGWRGVGTPHPELVVQRRSAFIQDRSSVTAGNPNLPAAINVPNE